MTYINSLGAAVRNSLKPSGNYTYRLYSQFMKIFICIVLVGFVILRSKDFLISIN